jgi:hypothetical protein
MLVGLARLKIVVNSNPLQKSKLGIPVDQRSFQLLFGLVDFL